MMVTSVTDPAVVSQPDAFTGSHGGLLADHLMHMAHCHYVASDAGNKLGRALLEAIRNAPPQWRMWVEGILGQADRVVRVPTPHPVANTLIPSLVAHPLTALSLTVAAAKCVDVAVLSRPAADAAEQTARADPRLTTLDTYALSEAKQREFFAMGARPLGRMQESEFLTRVIEPVVRWASGVRIIDPWLGSSLFVRGRKSNWPAFKRTVASIYRCWDEACVEKKDTFRIITFPVRAETPEQERQYGDLLRDYDAQASRIGEELAMGPHLEVALINCWNQEVRDITHDRYLVTNRNVALAFSRGFDLMTQSDSRLRQCSVSIYPGRSGGSLRDRLSARVIGSWRPRQNPMPANTPNEESRSGGVGGLGVVGDSWPLQETPR